MRVATRTTATALGLALLAATGCGGNGSTAPSLTMPSAAAHATKYFPATGGTVHSECTCDDCHGAFSTFARFDCLGCHAGAHVDQATITARHAGVPNFVWSSEACYMCHKNGAGVNHVPFFPITSGSHAGLACAQCHVDPANRKTLACAGCHADAATAGQHAAVAGYGFTTALCLRCHADGQVLSKAGHTRFPIVSGNHAGSSCLACHPAFRTDKAWAADFTQYTCYAAGCHDATQVASRHTGVSRFAATSAACYGCHPGGRGGD